MKFFDSVRQIIPIFYYTPLLWFTQIFAPKRWAVPILSCSQLVIYLKGFIRLEINKLKGIPYILFPPEP